VAAVGLPKFCNVQFLIGRVLKCFSSVGGTNSQRGGSAVSTCRCCVRLRRRQFPRRHNKPASTAQTL